MEKKRNYWMDALKEYNKGMSQWCIPRKGTDEYAIVAEIMFRMKREKTAKKEPKKKQKKIKR